VRNGFPLEDIQQRLKCGTACGSCLPQVRRMLRKRTAGQTRTT
jgi:NAD(P)H-nitrite reductase large subunit